MHTSYNLPPAGTAPDQETVPLPHISDGDEKKIVFGGQLVEIEELTYELKRVLINCEPILETEGIRGQVETLERWAESYRCGVEAAGRISTIGPLWLSDLRGRLKMAADKVIAL